MLVAVARGRRGGHPAAMADLEKHAIKRDRRFIVRLVVVLLLCAGAGVIFIERMTSGTLGSCAAETFGGASGEQAPAED